MPWKIQIFSVENNRYLAFLKHEISYQPPLLNALLNHALKDQLENKK